MGGQILPKEGRLQGQVAGLLDGVEWEEGIRENW